MNVVDSSGWLEYFADAPNADFFAPAVEDFAHLVVPTICIFEVFKKMRAERGEEPALEAVAQMQRGTVVDLDPGLAMEAAETGLVHHLPMADSIVMATALRHQALLWTQDADFKDIAGVKFKPKAKK